MTRVRRDDHPLSGRTSENQILDLIVQHRSTIVFANSRRLAERLTAHLNELQAERLGPTRRSVSAAR